MARLHIRVSNDSHELPTGAEFCPSIVAMENPPKTALAAYSGDHMVIMVIMVPPLHTIALDYTPGGLIGIPLMDS